MMLYARHRQYVRTCFRIPHDGPALPSPCTPGPVGTLDSRGSRARPRLRRSCQSGPSRAGSVTLGLLVGLGLLLCSALAFAGDYHTGTTLICAQCHVSHDSATPAISTGTGTRGTYDPLLQQDINKLCLSCHDGRRDAPDVSGTHANGYTREAGALTTGAAPNETWKGHALSALTCISCHDPHGEAGSRPAGSQYRNLRIRPSGAATDRPVTYAIGTNDLTKDIFERDARLGQIAVHYSQKNVDFNRPGTQDSGLSYWCASCHPDFHGDSYTPTLRDQSAPTGTGWLRHPTGDAAIGAVGGQHSSLDIFNDARRPNRVKVMSANGIWSQPYARGVTLNCLTCHKAHGNQNPFGLIYMSGTGTINEEGDTNGAQVQDLCRQCHVQ